MQFRLFFVLAFIVLVITVKVWALPEIENIELELGEDYSFKLNELKPNDKIWIENKDILKAEIKDAFVFFKTQQTGTSYIRLGPNLRFIAVKPIGSKRNRAVWNELVKKYSGLNVNNCGNQLCAYGKLIHFKDYLTITKLGRDHQAPVIMSLETTEKLQKEIRQYISKQLRNYGQTPQKIIFADKWRTYYKPNSVNETLKKELSYLGIELITQENASQLADNIQVTVQIVELNKSFIRKFGLNWPTQYQAQILNLRKLQTTPSFEIALNAAESAGEAKILASPKLVCRSGKEAEFFAGGEFPVKVQNLRSNHLEWKKYGIGLKLKPQVDPLGQLNLQIDTEISSVDQSLKVDDMPAVQISRVSSFFDLINNKTISLSGLIRSENSQNTEGLPFLQNLPVLGSLFRSKNFIEHKTELAIFVTPKLINPESEDEP